MSRPGLSRGHAVMTGLAHTFLIAMLFVLPEVIMALAMPHRHGGWGGHAGFYLRALLMLAVFYINYFLLVDRNLGGEHSHPWRFVGINLLLVVAAVLIGYYLSEEFFNSGRPPRRHPPEGWHRVLRSTSFILRDAVMMVLAVGFATALRVSARLRQARQRQQELIAAQRTTELASLRAQLHPHFLFNSLNTIYTLIDINTEDAKDAVLRLSKLMRYMLDGERVSVRLQKELEFMDAYVELMRMRISAQSHPVKFKTEVDSDNNFHIAPLLLLPLVENAFKYGNCSLHGTPITVRIEVKDGYLTCETSNHFDTPGSHGAGTGLANLRRRLSLIYGNAASLNTHVHKGTYTATLRVPNLPLHD